MARRIGWQLYSAYCPSLDEINLSLYQAPLHDILTPSFLPVLETSLLPDIYTCIFPNPQGRRNEHDLAGSFLPWIVNA